MSISSMHRVIAVFAAASMFVLSAGAAAAQTVGVSAWTNSMGGTMEDEGFGIGLTPDGGIVVAGSFQGSADFDPGQGTSILNSQGLTDAFVAKLSADGSLVWAVSIGGTHTTEANDVAVDANGHIYVIGNFRDRTDFDPGPAVRSIESTGSTDVFLLKLDPAGSFVRVTTLGSDQSDDGQAVAVDGRDQVYITGSFEEEINVNPDPNGKKELLNSEGDDDVFVVRYAPDGSLLRAWSMGGSQDAVGRDIFVDGAGNVYIAGEFEGKIDFDPDLDDIVRSYGDVDIFVVKFDDAADLKWSAKFGSLYEDDRPALTVDRYGAVYVTGRFESTANFATGPEEYLLTSHGAEDMFLAKLDTFGRLAWAEAIGGLESDQGKSIIAGKYGDFFVTGSFGASVDFDPGPGQAVLNSTGDRDKDIFLARYSSNGSLYAAQAMSGPQDETGNAIALDPADGVFVTGYYESTVDFNVGATAQLRTAAGKRDVFVVKREYDALPFGASLFLPRLKAGDVVSLAPQ